MGVRENKVETYFDQRIREIGGLTRKWVSPGRDGVPDRIAIIAGVTMFVEIKTTDGRLSSVQAREQQRLKEAGAFVTTLYGHDHINHFVEWIKRNLPVQ